MVYLVLGGIMMNILALIFMTKKDIDNGHDVVLGDLIVNIFFSLFPLLIFFISIFCLIKDVVILEGRKE